MKRTAIIITISAILMSSCASMQQGGQNKTLGAGAGAAAGALLGQVLGKSTEATLIGGALGAVLGYAIASHIDSQTNKISTEQQAKAMLPPEKRKGTVIQVQERSVSPTEQFTAGEKVTVRVIYIIHDETKRQMPVQEKKAIWRDGQLVKEITNNQEVRENGMYESLTSFTLPNELEKGEYEFRHSINTDSVSKTSFVGFHVI